MLAIKIFVNDFNCFRYNFSQKGVANEYRKNYFFSSNGISAFARVSQMCRTILRSLQSSEIFMPGSVSMYDVCTVDISRESTRYHCLSSIVSQQTLSYGHSWTSLQKHAGRRQRQQRLAYLRRLRANIDPSGSPALSRRTAWSRSREYGLRVGCDDHRSVSGAFSVGAFSKEQGSDQAPYALRFARPHSVFHRDHRRESDRRQHPRYPDPGGRIVLHYGSRLSRFCKALCHASGTRNICNTNQIQHAIPTPLLAPSGQNNRTAVRSNNCINRCAIGQGLSAATSSDQILRFRNQEIFQVFDQQLRYRRTYRGSTLQMPLESRVVLPVDQTTFTNQSILWDFRERRQNTSLDCDLGLSARRDYQKTSSFEAKSLHNFTNFQREHI